MNDTFTQHRPYLIGVAYRMLGTMAEAEDAVQNAYLRWHGTDQARIDNPRAFLTQTVVRLCLDELKSARARREEYVGEWLPEPVMNSRLQPDLATEMADNISMALMITLERLTPLERAAFLLHDVFDQDYDEIAATLGKTEATCRQLVSRARKHVRGEKPRVVPPMEEQQKMVQQLFQAVMTGDVNLVKGMLAEDAVFLSDGGGKVVAALNPLIGAEKISKFLLGLKARYNDNVTFEWTEINGEPGLILTGPDAVPSAYSFDFEEGRIKAMYVVRNPDKLRAIQ